MQGLYLVRSWKEEIKERSEGHLEYLSSPKSQGKASEGKKKDLRRRSKFSRVAAAIVGKTKFWICNRRLKFLQQEAELVVDLDLGGYWFESQGLGICQLKDL